MKDSFLNRIKSNKDIICYVLVLIGLGYIAWFYFSPNGLAALHSDATAGIQKMEEALNEHNFIPHNWYYANTMNIPWSMAIQILFYRITGDYIYSIVCSKLIRVIAMVCGLMLFCRKVLQLKRSFASGCLIIVLSPISYVYFKSMYVDGYSLRILIWFVLLMLGLYSMDGNTLKPKWRYLLPFCALLVAFMTGDNRYIAIMIIPLLVSFMLCYVWGHWTEEASSLKKPVLYYGVFVLCMGGCVLLCYGIEHLLKKSHTVIGGYYDNNILAVDNIKDQFVNRTVAVVKEFMEGFGYIGDAPQISRASILSFCAIIFMILIIIVVPCLMVYHFSSYDVMIQRLIVIRWTGYLVSAYFGIFALNGVNFRHFLTYIILDFFLAVYYISTRYMINNQVGYMFSWGVLILYILMNWAYIPEIAPASLVDDRYAVIDELKSRGLTYGYGEYWSASVIQTFSNDELRILPCRIDERMNWYCPKELYLPADEEEATFYISEKETYNNNSGNDTFRKLYNDYTEKLEIGNYVVLIYDYNIVHNFKEYRAAGQFNLLKYMYSSVPDERDSSDSMYLASDAYIYGPYITLLSGEHQLLIKADGEYECRVYSGENEILPATLLKAGENQMKLSVENDMQDVEIWIHNTGIKEMKVEEISLEW